MTDIRTILVVVSDEVSGRVPLDVAVMVGRELDAHVQGLHVKTDPTSAVPLVGEGMSGVMVEDMINAAEQQAEQRAAATRAMFDQRCETFGIPRLQTPAGAITGFSIGWREEVGREEDSVARYGRIHDLIVLGRPLSDNELPSMMTLNAALMESGRPLLVAPPTAPSSLGRNVAIAWNGSAEAARSVSAALPFLQKADSVRILAAEEQGSDAVLTAGDLVTYLAWHGVTATTQSFHAGVTHAGEGLEREVLAIGADLLVMGAYTHSRLRQLILGGVTRHMLHHATIPVLMTH